MQYLITSDLHQEMSRVIHMFHSTCAKVAEQYEDDMDTFRIYRSAEFL